MAKQDIQGHKFSKVNPQCLSHTSHFHSVYNNAVWTAYATSAVMFDKIMYMVLHFSYKRLILTLIKNRPAFYQLKQQGWGRQD